MRDKARCGKQGGLDKWTDLTSRCTGLQAPRKSLPASLDEKKVSGAEQSGKPKLLQMTSSALNKLTCFP